VVSRRLVARKSRILAIVGGLAAAALTFGAAPAARAAGNPIPAAPAVARALAVVIVNRPDLGDKHFTATGFVVGSDSKHSYLLTAYHVLCDADEENCLTRASTIPGLRCSDAPLPSPSADQTVVVLLHTDPTTRTTACVENFGTLTSGNDLLLLRIDRPNLAHLSIARTVMTGWPVAAAGYAAGILEQMHDQPGPPEIPPGTVTWIDTDDPASQAPRQLRDGVETSEGDSGGPLFDMNMGAVVGVVRGQSTVNGRLENAFIAVGPGAIIQICNVPSIHPFIQLVDLNLTPSSGPVGIAQAPSAAGASPSHTTALQSAQSSLIVPPAPKSIGSQFSLVTGSDPRSEYQSATYYADMGDVAAAFSHMRDAANAGYGPAEAGLAWDYYYGIGVAIDPNQAFHWLSAAAAAGDSTGQRELGDWSRLKGDVQGARKAYGAAYASLQKAAAAGDARAQYWLGIFLSTDAYGQKPDLAASMKWFVQASDKDSDALVEIGWANYYGRGVPRNTQLAVDTFLRAANKGNTDGALAIAYACTHADWKKPDFRCAAQWDQAVADRNPSAANELGWFYEYGRGVPTDFAQALKWFKRAVALGDTYAYDNIGTMYFYGRGVSRDYGQARTWVAQGAALEDDRAEYDLAYLYAYGLGVKQDDGLAIQWFTRSADQDNTSAIDELADHADNNAQYPQAFALYKRAAVLGDAYAQFNLGLMYKHGHAGPGGPNYVQALKWFGAAAQQGAGPADYGLGELYENGLGTAKDLHRAYESFRRAADAGVPEAQNRVGEAYARLGGWTGIDFVPKDYKAALGWFTLAAEQGDPDGLADLGLMYLRGFGASRDYVRAGAYLGLSLSPDAPYAASHPTQIKAELSEALAHASKQQMEQFAAAWARKASSSHS
jgi:uncharacterized protein